MIPVDGSGNSKRASDFALELAKKLGSSVVFIHVLEIPISSYKYQRVTGEILKLLEEGGNDLIANFEKSAEANGVSYESVLSHGDPARQILLIAKKRRCDCIVIGKRGLGRIQRMLMGSVSDQVARLADVPVITVK